MRSDVVKGGLLSNVNKGECEKKIGSVQQPTWVPTDQGGSGDFEPSSLSSVMPSQTNWQERPTETPTHSGPPPERTNFSNSVPGDHYPTPGNDATNQGVTVSNENPKKKKNKSQH